MGPFALPAHSLLIVFYRLLCTLNSVAIHYEMGG